MDAASLDRALGRQLVLDELFDLSLYRALHATASPALRPVLEQLIPIEARHRTFWQEFFGEPVERLDMGRRLKLWFLATLCRLFGDRAIHLVLEAIEVYGVRKYLKVWARYRDHPLGGAVRGVLEDEFKHEDEVVTGDAARRLNPERVRNIFLGLNDGLVEILGAVSGFFAAFSTSSAVVVAGFTVSVAGALSMAAGAWIAASSEAEVRDTDSARRRFLGETVETSADAESATVAAVTVGLSYFIGTLVPILPVLAGARTVLASALSAGTLIVVVSTILAFLSGMDVKRRILVNLVIIAAAVGVTYAIGLLTRVVFGISV
jgi:VIT1/CCC1 family predicted Fe2+/Mn2+ transporter